MKGKEMLQSSRLADNTAVSPARVTVSSLFQLNAEIPDRVERKKTSEGNNSGDTKERCTNYGQLREIMLVTVPGERETTPSHSISAQTEEGREQW